METSILTPEVTRDRLDPNANSELEREFIKFLDEEMVGQADAKKLALRIFRAIFNPLKAPDAPIFAAIFAGMSRTGKTFLVRLLAKFFHGREDAFVKANGGEFMDKHQLNRLIGAPPGYIGFNDQDDPRKKPLKPEDKDKSAILSMHNLNRSKLGSKYDVIFVLLDEWEKFHPDVINILLSGLDYGEAELANNETINFRRVVLIMTSNMGMQELTKRKMGFNQDDPDNKSKKEIAAAVFHAYQGTTSPEFRNRIDAVCVFDQLSDAQLLDIVGLEFGRLQKQILSGPPKGIFTLAPDDDVKALLLAKTLEGEGRLGNLKRVVKEQVVEPLGALVTHGHVRFGDRVMLSTEDGAIKFDRERAVGVPTEPVTALPGADGNATGVNSGAATAEGAGDDAAKRAADEANAEPEIRQPFTLQFAAVNDESFDHMNAQLRGAFAKLSIVKTKEETEFGKLMQTQVGLVPVNVTTIRVHAEIKNMVALKGAFPMIEIRTVEVPLQ